MRHARWVPLAILCLVSSGCVLSQTTDGAPLSEDRVSSIVVGRSTRADVVRLLGSPDEIIYSNLEHDALMERAFRYERSRTKTTFFTIVVFSTARDDTDRDHVIVFFDDHGVVEDVAARLDADRPRYGGPWGDGRE